MSYRNAEHALVVKARDVLAHGGVTAVRGQETRELLQQVVTLERPLERTIVVDGRHNNVFAAIAETVWVMAGRDDIGFLEPYVPRAGDYSDDGAHWRGAYGPRLRDWNGVDQVRQAVDALKSDPATRRAVAVLFDPDRDFVASKDIPCTNWLHFMVRNGRLDLEVAIRSNDLFWGFSGINTFEWSVLQEMVARWVGVEVGVCTFYISSLHLYDRHFERAETVARARPRTRRQAGERFHTSLADLNAALDLWFEFEGSLRSGGSAPELSRIVDPLLRDFAAMLMVYWQARLAGAEAAIAALEQVSSPDLVEAARDYLHWKYGVVAEVPATVSTAELVRDYLIRLHRRKDAVYGDSWKRRGEVLGVMANIARKYDRLSLDAGEGDGETRLDTVADLAVYALKYQTFLNDAAGIAIAEGTWSDGPNGLESLAAQMPIAASADWDQSLEQVRHAFEALEASIVADEPSSSRTAQAGDLAAATVSLLAATLERDPNALLTTLELDLAEEE